MSNISNGKKDLSTKSSYCLNNFISLNKSMFSKWWQPSYNVLADNFEIFRKKGGSPVPFLNNNFAETLYLRMPVMIFSRCKIFK